MASNSVRRYAVDTSFAVPLIDAEHEFHAAVMSARQGRVLALAGHAAFETYSVLTRMQGLDGALAAEVLATSFPEWCPLSARASNKLLARLAELDIVGGSVFDALVGAAALDNDRVLLTRDRRAESVYRKLGVTYELVTD